MIVGQAAFDALCDGRRVSLIVDQAQARVWQREAPAVVRCQPAAFQKGIESTVLGVIDGQGDDGLCSLVVTPGDVRDVPRLLAAQSDVLYTRPPEGPGDRPPAAMWGEMGGEPEAVPESQEQLVARALGEATGKRQQAIEALDRIDEQLANLSELGIVAGPRMHALKEKAHKARQDLARFTGDVAA